MLQFPYMNRSLSVKPFFSIIIPTLNEESYLPDLLKDLKQQTFSDFEILVVDAQSTDKTPQIVKKNQKAILINSPKADISNQRNLGGKNAKGKYFLFIDADTRLPTYFLEGLKYRLSIKRPDVFTTWLLQNSQRQTDKTITALMNLVLELAKIIKYPGAYGAMMGCKKTTFSKLGGFKSEFTFDQDAEFVRRAVKKDFSFEIFRDPRFVFSLRRFQKEGTLPLLRKYAILHFKRLLQGHKADIRFKDYPMLGGQYYQDKKKTYQFILRLETTFQKIKQFKDKQKLQQFLESLFLD